LSAVAGIALVASMMIAGYIYMTARDNAGQVEKAKSRIVQTLFALILFIFMYALLNFLIPGGLGLG
jgi:archaellum component FlaF (FlaF/FlaG flagellin family)